jgi:hypothetical protein
LSDTYQVGIVTIATDLHGLAIQKGLKRYDDVSCHVIESDNMCGNPTINWSSARKGIRESYPILNRENQRISLKNMDVIWWRRFNYKQKIVGIDDEVVTDLINNECTEALLGVMMTEFSGTWISSPFATRRAENKIVQLKVAQEMGFKVPRTLVSQNPDEIRKFCKILNNQVVVKPIKGSTLQTVFTRKITEQHLRSDPAIKLAPAIYQEYIPGYRHIRAHCFGNSVYAALIDSEDLDWRENLDVPFTIINLEKKLKNLIQSVVRALDLKMGIIDLKLGDDNTATWLEINPQGQFLFIEGLSGLELMSQFSEFLYSEAKAARNKQRTFRLTY